jgi:hypothetical protein
VTAEEAWLPVRGWEGHYEVSDQGHVRTRQPRARLWPHNGVSNLEWHELQTRRERERNTDGGLKLTWMDVQRIRELAPTMSRSKLAERSGVSKRLVVQIVLGARWKAPPTGGAL